MCERTHNDSLHYSRANKDCKSPPVFKGNKQTCIKVLWRQDNSGGNAGPRTCVLHAKPNRPAIAYPLWIMAHVMAAAQSLISVITRHC